MPLPWPCFGLPKNKNKNKSKKKQIKVKVKANTNDHEDLKVKISVKHHGNKNDAIQSQFNQYNYYDDDYYDDDSRINNFNGKIDRAYFENDANWNYVTSSSSSFSQENNDLIHGGLTEVTKKCKQIGASWNCFCQGLDKTVFKCNMFPYQIGIY